jgi:glutathione S-transferase
MSNFTLILGNKNVSSWSLRGWLVLKHAGVDFEEVMINLRPTWDQEKLDRLTPASKVPVVKHGDQFIWDSLAIAEYFNDLYPRKSFWPDNIKTRAHARCISAEMHSGFVPLRSVMPMDCLNTYDTPEMTADLKKDIERINELWIECRDKYAEKGPYLFGAYSIADMMYAPVVFRLKAYQIKLPEMVQNYCEAVIDHPHIQEWLENCNAFDIA